MMEHPELYPAQIFRGRCRGINSMTAHVELDIDLGFEICLTVVGTLYNVDSPKVDVMNPDTTESHAAEAYLYRLSQLINDKPLMIITYRKVAFIPMPPEYEFSLFYHTPTIKSNWHSVEHQLVRENHVAWRDNSIPIPTVE